MAPRLSAWLLGASPDGLTERALRIEICSPAFDCGPGDSGGLLHS